MIRVFVRLAVAAVAVLLLPAHAVFASDYPDKPVRVVIPWPAGGPTDVIGRLMVNHLSIALKRPFVVDNRGGASGMIGTAAVAKAAPDGYTLLLNSGSTQIVYPGLFKDLKFDPVADFEPIGLVGATPIVVVATPSLPAKDIKELVALARSKPRGLNLAIPGAGTLPHLVSELVLETAGAEMTMVSYKGTPPAINDVIAGTADLTYVSIATAIPLIKSSKLRALGITAPRRVASLPDVPTMSEAGLTGLEVSTWYGLWAPKGTPKEIVELLNKQIARAAADEDLKAKFAAISTDLELMTPQQFGAFYAQESKRWLKVLEQAKVRPQ